MEETSIIDLDSPSTLHHSHRCCFHLPCFTSSRHVTLTSPPPLSTSSSFWDTSRWWARPYWAFKKVREWSEIVAGPKWKTFIRRFNRRRNNHHAGNNTRHQFQYDPLSYALNFDEGGQNGHFEDGGNLHFHDFSSRLAASPSSNGVPAC